MDSVECAAHIRHALASAFPGTRFEVRAHRGGGAAFWPAIDITWIGAPEEAQVRAIADRFLGYRVRWSGDADLTLFLEPVAGVDVGGKGRQVRTSVASIDYHHS